MAEFGLMRINGEKWDNIQNGIKQFVSSKSKDKVDSNKNEVEWLSIIDNVENKNNGILGDISVITHHIRKRIDTEDDLTDQIYTHYTNTTRNISFIKPVDSNDYIWLSFEKGASNVVNNLTSFLNLPIAIRHRISFNEDFIEYLNTSNNSYPGYSNIFGSDMQSVKRKAEHNKHRLVETYYDLGTRENNVQEKFTNAAGVLITPPSQMSSILPSLELVITTNGWIVINPKVQNPSIAILYSSLIYGYQRISKSFNAFQSLHIP